MQNEMYKNNIAKTVSNSGSDVKWNGVTQMFRSKKSPTSCTIQFKFLRTITYQKANIEDSITSQRAGKCRVSSLGSDQLNITGLGPSRLRIAKKIQTTVAGIPRNLIKKSLTTSMNRAKSYDVTCYFSASTIRLKVRVPASIWWGGIEWNRGLWELSSLRRCIQRTQLPYPTLCRCGHLNLNRRWKSIYWVIIAWRMSQSTQIVLTIINKRTSTRSTLSQLSRIDTGNKFTRLRSASARTSNIQNCWTDPSHRSNRCELSYAAIYYEWTKFKYQMSNK